MADKKKIAGNAYLEALGVALVMLLLFACAMHFARSAHGRLLEARSLRAQAWSKALAGCDPRSGLGLSCNEPPQPQARAPERDVAAFIAAMLAQKDAR